MFELYPFQEEDLAKLASQAHGLIGSEMGTGKTHEAIALDVEWNPKARKPTLVVAPLNTHGSWVDKYAIQSPKTDCVVIDRKDRDAFVEAVRLKRGDVFICHWEALRLLPELQGRSLSVVIADEVHRASNRKAQATRALKKLDTEHRLAMSGTASGDKPEGLWSILNWLYPRKYTSYWKFRKEYCIEETVRRGPAVYTQITGVQNIDELLEDLDPYYVRHLKRERCCDHHPTGVMDWLPEKAYDTIHVKLSPTQRRIYEEMRREMVAWLGQHQDSPLVASVVVAQMTRLSQIALATPTIAPSGTILLSAPSSKLDALKELTTDNPNKQFVVFTSSKKAAYLAQDFVSSSCVLSGDTPQRQRELDRLDFINGKYQCYICVIAAAAEGIDGLQHATDTAVFLDRSWSTVKNKQAEDRLHRDGQKNTVQIIDVVADDTLDWGRNQKLELKWAWIKQVLGDKYYAMQQQHLQEEL